MKRFLSLILALAVLSGMGTGLSGIAGAGDPSNSDPTFEVIDIDAANGAAAVPVYVNVCDNPGIWSTQIFVIYDDRASYADFTPGDVFPDSAFAMSPVKYPVLRDRDIPASFTKYAGLEAQLAAENIDCEGKVMTVVSIENPALENVEGDGTLFALSLDVSALPEGEYDINIVYSPLQTIDANYESVAFELVQGVLTIGTSGDHTHNWVLSENVGATCEEGGYELYTCSICGDEFTVETDALGHDYVPYEQEPSCTEDGYTDYVCSRCGSSYEAEGAPALGHDFTAEVVGDEYCAYFGSCIELSVYYKSCTRCGAASDTDTFTYDFPRHQYSAVSTEPTCTEDGFVTHTCSLCGNSFETAGDPALGHDFTAEVVSDEYCAYFGSCIEPSVYYKSCTRCGAASDTDTFTYDFARHQYSPVYTAPTCTEKGYTTSTCALCGSSFITYTEDPLGHDFSDEFTTDVRPTTESTGLKSKHCSRCDAVTEETVIKAIVWADANGDGKATSKDTSYLKKYLAGAVEVTDDILYNCDFNGDGKITSKDLAALKKFMATGVAPY